MLIQYHCTDKHTESVINLFFCAFCSLYAEHFEHFRIAIECNARHFDK